MKQSNPQPIRLIPPKQPEKAAPAPALPLKTGVQAGCEARCSWLTGDAYWQCLYGNPTMACS